MDTKIDSPPNPAETAPPRGGIRPHALARVLRLIESRLQEPLLVEDLAREACLSPFHFARMFKQSTGHSPHAYLVARRIEIARELLATTDLRIREVGKRAGFSTHAHFCSVFRTQTGMTPATWRRQARAEPPSGNGRDEAAAASLVQMFAAATPSPEDPSR
jgi:AraC family transcriptional regulator